MVFQLLIEIRGRAWCPPSCQKPPITLLFMCGGISFSVYAGANHSQSEAVAWISARKAEGWAQDYDKDTFTSVPQCVDLITKTSHTYNGIAL